MKRIAFFVQLPAHGWLIALLVMARDTSRVVKASRVDFAPGFQLGINHAHIRGTIALRQALLLPGTRLRLAQLVRRRGGALLLRRWGKWLR